MKRRTDLTAAFCECGRPAIRARQPITGAQCQADRCERCARHERLGLNCPPATCGHPAPGIHDHDPLGIISLTRIATACDAFFARRALPRPAWNAPRQTNPKTAA